MKPESKSSYLPFEYQGKFEPLTGWDRYAETYAGLLVPETIYYLTKEISHGTIARYLNGRRNLTILDLNCGTGNDFPFFLAQGWDIIGCDGSVGMLNKAHEKYRTEIKKGKIKLYHGFLEDLDKQAFDGRKFDLIYSITGGFSYIDDLMFKQVYENLGCFLKKDGYLITAHLTNFSLVDSVYSLIRRRWGTAFIRLKKGLKISIKGQEQNMYLRTLGQLKKMPHRNLEYIKSHPLLAFTPPYQSGYKPKRKLYKFHRYLELKSIPHSFLSLIADQVVTVYQKINTVRGHV